MTQLFTTNTGGGGGGGGVTDHGALTGLGDDDHTQYSKKASNLSDLTNVGTARTNLGLGSAATHAHGDYDLAGTAAALVDDLSGVTNASAARTVLGLGTAAVRADTYFEQAGVAAALVDDLSGVTNAGAARTNLGLGTAATHNHGDYEVAGAAATAQSNAIAAATALVDDLSGVTDQTTARTNLGLGTAATRSDTYFEQAGVAAALVDDLSGVTNAGAARTNLGLGSAATHAHSDYEAAGTAILKSFIDAKGDILVGSANDTPAILAVGTNGQALIADSAQSSGLKWIDNTRILRAVVDGGGSVLTTGAKKLYITVPFACNLTKIRLLADVSGSIVLDVWKDTYANFPPTVADTITASAKPTLSSAQKTEDATLTGWTKTFAAGDIIEINIDSVTSITKIILDMFVTPS